MVEFTEIKCSNCGSGYLVYDMLLDYCITRHLKRIVKRLEPELLNRLFSHINILEECYRYHMDHPCDDIEGQIDLYLAKQ